MCRIDLLWARPYARTRASVSVDEVYHWQCLVSREHGWVPFTFCEKGRDLNEAMNFSFCSKPKREIIFQMADRDYTIDWTRMVQRNIRSGTERHVSSCVPASMHSLHVRGSCVRVRACSYVRGARCPFVGLFGVQLLMRR